MKKIAMLLSVIILLGLELSVQESYGRIIVVKRIVHSRVGKKHLLDGRSYVGDLSKNGNPEGFGTMYFPDFYQYVGTFKNGLYDGHGTIYKSNGFTFSGRFINGKLIKITTHSTKGGGNIRSTLSV